MLTLHQTRRAWGVPNISPFCAKLETYLRMADIPYEIAVEESPYRDAPHGKVPFVRFEGQLIADSSVIIAHLKQRLGDTLDAHLTSEQRALGHLVQRTLEEGTYWASVYARWYDEDNFDLVRQTYFERVFGRALRWVIPDLVRRGVLSALYLQGTSRHERAWVFASAARDMEAISQLLGDTPFLFGEAPCSFDAVLYAFGSAIWKTPFAKNFAAPPANIAAHLERMQQRYFPELSS
jgi:glutathione S-transferase